MDYNLLLEKYLSVLQTNLELNNTITENNKTISQLKDTITELNLTISVLNQTIDELKKNKNDTDDSLSKINKKLKSLEKRINQNSTNSSCPPSTDNDHVKAKRKTKSLRKQSGKPRGGQPGHKGETVKMSDMPNTSDIDIPTVCPNCGHPI